LNTCLIDSASAVCSFWVPGVSYPPHRRLGRSCLTLPPPFCAPAASNAFLPFLVLGLVLPFYSLRFVFSWFWTSYLVLLLVWFAVYITPGFCRSAAVLRSTPPSPSRLTSAALRCLLPACWLRFFRRFACCYGCWIFSSFRWMPLARNAWTTRARARFAWILPCLRAAARIYRATPFLRFAQILRSCACLPAACLLLPRASCCQRRFAVSACLVSRADFPRLLTPPHLLVRVLPLQISACRLVPFLGLVAPLTRRSPFVSAAQPPRYLSGCGLPLTAPACCCRLDAGLDAFCVDYRCVSAVPACLPFLRAAALPACRCVCTFCCRYLVCLRRSACLACRCCLGTRCACLLRCVFCRLLRACVCVTAVPLRGAVLGAVSCRLNTACLPCNGLYYACTWLLYSFSYRVFCCGCVARCCRSDAASLLLLLPDTRAPPPTFSYLPLSAGFAAFCRFGCCVAAGLVLLPRLLYQVITLCRGRRRFSGTRAPCLPTP